MSQQQFMKVGGSALPLGNFTSKGKNFAAQAALITRVLIRKDVGLRVLSWSNVAVAFTGMLAMSWWDNAHFSVGMLLGGGMAYSDHAALRNCAFVWMAFAIWERFKRLDDEKRGVQPHNHSPGITRFGLNELPLSRKWIAVAVEPAVVFLAGAVLRRMGFPMLGLVIIGSAICFAISEWQLFEQLKEQIRDEHDIGLEAQWRADLMKEGAERRVWRGSEETAGLATGIDGLESSIGKRASASENAHSGGAL